MSCTMSRSRLLTPWWTIIKNTPYAKLYSTISIVITREWCVPHAGACPEDCEQKVGGCLVRSFEKNNYIAGFTIELRKVRLYKKPVGPRKDTPTRVGDYG
jgi:hypothetical protein